MKLSKPTYNDLNEIINIINDAKTWFKINNIDQWQDGYPNIEVIKNDIDNNYAYIIKNNHDIIAYFALIFANDSNYEHIYSGKWSNNHDYAVIHRIVINDKYKGQGLSKDIFMLIIDLVKNNNYDTIRIDTHEDNYIMRNLLKKLNFKQCGFIYLASGAPRIAYDLTIND